MEQKKHKWQQTIVSSIGSLGLIAILIFIALNVPLGPPLQENIELEGTHQPDSAKFPANAESPASAESIDDQEIDPMIILVLGIGIYVGEDEAEAIYVVDVDESGETIEVTTFPPSLIVDIEGEEKLFKMVYRDELHSPDGDEESATNLMAQVLIDNFGIIPDHYIVVQEDYLADMVDTIGGIDLYLSTSFADIPAGQQHLDGVQTWEYVTSMQEPGVPYELPRIERHRQTLVGIRDQLASPSNLPKLVELLQQYALEGGAKTDLSTQEILSLIELMEHVEFQEAEFDVTTEN